MLKPSPGVQENVEKGLHPERVGEKEENHGDFWRCHWCIAFVLAWAREWDLRKKRKRNGGEECRPMKEAELYLKSANAKGRR